MTPVNRQHSISAYSTLSHTATSRRETGSSSSPEGFIVRQKSRGRTIVCNGIRDGDMSVTPPEVRHDVKITRIIFKLVKFYALVD